MTQLYLFDIEGTTTDINFVHKVLFPYSLEKMDSYIESHLSNENVKKVIEEVKRTVLSEEEKEISDTEAIAKLKSWIQEDRKHPALKEIQGLIWDSGYLNNHFKGHVYKDVPDFFKSIVESGNKIGIYSSGSVHAQKLIFGYSSEGDLTPYISFYFDTKIGHKREVSSYSNIASEVNFPIKDIHFFSDVPEELSAAQNAGMQVTHVIRQELPPSDFDRISSFKEISVKE